LPGQAKTKISQEEIMSTKIYKTLVLAVTLACSVPLNHARAAQNPEKEKANVALTTQPKSSTGFRLEYSIRELEDGKRVNGRNYTLLVIEDDWGKIRVGNRVPYAASSGTQTATLYQYQDVGMNIDSRLHEQENGLVLRTSIEWSSVASGEHSNNPVFRQLRFDSQSVIPQGKPTILGTMDDVTSTHRYEIEVTATKIR
jgi:hypothetical protein